MQNVCPITLISGNVWVREKDADVQTHATIDFERFYKAHANAV